MRDIRITARKFIAGQVQETAEVLTREEALQIRINGRAYTITMRTPGQDLRLGAGLLFTEAVLRTPADILSVTETPAPAGDFTLSIDFGVQAEALAGKNLFNRAIASSASCGVCGKIDLCDLVSPDPPIVTTHRLDIRLVPFLLQEMNARQSVFEQTGGSHAAALFTIRGQLLSVQEDIGRHNAVDKAIGDLFLQNRLTEAAIMCISGRVSYEIVAKCARAGIPFLLAVSAPSSLAVDVCQQKGITLLGFCRDTRATVYTNAEGRLEN